MKKAKDSTSKSEFIKIREGKKPSLALPDLPGATNLKIAENHYVRTRVLSDLAAFKMKTERVMQKFTKKRMESNETKSSDQALLLSTLGVMNNKSVRELPKDLSKLKDMLASSRSADKLSLGSPATREDTQVLANWLDRMLKSALSENNQDIEELCETALTIYEVCFHEIVRQVSVQCVERGELINLVWKAYLGILEKALKISKAVQAYQLSEFTTEKASIQSGFKQQIDKLHNENQLLAAKNEKLERLIAIREEESSFLTKKELKVNEKVMILQHQYEKCKRDLVNFQEDYRILKVKLANSNVEFIENKQGVIEPRLISIQKIKRRSDKELRDIVKLDPLLSAQMISAEKSEILMKNIEKYEDFSREIMNKTDFSDKSVGNECELASAESQTDFPLLLATVNSDSPPHHSVKPSIDSIFDVSDDSVTLTDDTNPQEIQKRAEEYLSRFKEKIDQVNSILKQMKTKIKNNFPENYQDEVLNNFYVSVADSISRLKEDQIPDAPKDASLVITRRKPRVLTFIQQNNPKPQSKPTIDLLSTITQKVLNTPAHKLKSIVFKKMLLKQINQFYELKVKKVSDGDRKQEMGQIVIENYYKRYGMPKVVESRYIQLLASCIKYKSIKRVYIFGSFLKLFKNNLQDDLGFYIDSLVSMKVYNYTENNEELKFPLDKALDWSKNSLSQILPEPDRHKIRVFIESYKQIDPATKQHWVDFDQLIEFSIEALQKHRNSTLDFLTSIYEAADLNQDGFLEFHEFNLINRHIAPENYSSSRSLDIFKEFCEIFTGEDEETVEALSFDNFSHLNRKYLIFTPLRLATFIDLKGEINTESFYMEVLKQSGKNIEKTLAEMRWRYFQARNLEKKEEMLGILDVVKHKIKQLKKPKAVLIALRLMDQESKRASILAELENILPSIAFNFD